MARLKAVGHFLMRPIVLAPVSVAVGACAAFGFATFPKLSSADAAAWASAIGTVAAVFVALGLALAEGRRRRLDAADQARGVSVLLLTTLVDWQRAIHRLASYVKHQRGMAITESFDEEGGDILRVPPLLERHLEKIHVLGAAAAPLSQGVIGAMYAKRMEHAVREAVKNYTGENVDVLEAFRLQLVKVSSELNEAIGIIAGNLKKPKR